MQKLATRLSAALFLLLIAVAQDAAAADWVEVGEDANGWVYFIDRDSIQAKSYGGAVSAWVRIMYPDGSLDNDLLEFDFSERTFRLRARFEYDSSGKMAESHTNPTEWAHVIPDTNAEHIYIGLKHLLGW